STQGVYRINIPIYASGAANCLARRASSACRHMDVVASGGLPATLPMQPSHMWRAFHAHLA
ncbi:hypothetical protein NL526_27800, partial [Klebsiella pneumoniae]|nr:hypothetical protein [Klebsiella pneumoniae]